MKVIVNGKLSVYPPRGTYQVDVRSMKPAGEGELQAAFEMLKQKLSEEGLFDASHKKSIPAFPAKDRNCYRHRRSGIQGYDKCGRKTLSAG